MNRKFLRKSMIFWLLIGKINLHRKQLRSHPFKLAVNDSQIWEIVQKLAPKIEWKRFKDQFSLIFKEMKRICNI